MSEKMVGRFTGFAPTFNMHRRYGGRFFGFTITKKRGVGVVEGVTLVRPQ